MSSEFIMGAGEGEGEGLGEGLGLGLGEGEGEGEGEGVRVIAPPRHTGGRPAFDQASRVHSQGRRTDSERYRRRHDR